MRLFLINLSSEILVNVAKNLQEQGHDIVYWTGLKHYFLDISAEKELFSDTIFHYSIDAVLAIPAPAVDISRFDPPSSELISEMLECESTVLTMIRRLDYSNISILKKKHLYYKYLEYWNGVLLKYKPDLIVFRAVPHSGYDFVLYSLAKKYNIKTIMFDTTVFNDRLLITEDFASDPLCLKEVYEKIKNEIHQSSELGPEKEAYYKKISDLSQDATPQYKKQLIKKMNRSLISVPSFRKIIKHIARGTLIDTVKYYFKSLFNAPGRPLLKIDEYDNQDYRKMYHLKKIKKINEQFISEYKECQKTVDYSKKYIYLALHYQPESNTSPMASFYVDQILIVKTIAASLPEGWLLYVKENIGQWNDHNALPHLFRYQGYYKEMALLKNVRLLDPEVSSFELVDNSQVVATATGTAGWEALARSKPVLFFGYPWYRYCDGAFRIHDVNSCRAAIEKIINGYKVEKQPVLNYLIALEKVTIEASHMEYMEKVSGIPREKSIKNITQAILEAI